MRLLLLFAVPAVVTCASPTPTPPAQIPVPSASTSATTVTPPVTGNGKARIDLGTRKSTSFLGENVLVDFCVVNTSAEPITIEVGGDYRGSPRSLRFKVQVKDAAGNVVPDPDPNPMNFGGMGYSPSIAPKEKWCQSLQLARYARIDGPGTYAITATHDLGWPAGTAPQGTTTITFAMPNASQAERVIAEMEALPQDPSTSAGKAAIAFADFSALRYDVYVASLALRAQKGIAHAIDGLEAIPTTNATRVLVSLLAHSDPAIARAAGMGLSMRLPDPALQGALGARNPFESSYADPRKYLIAHAWDPAFADDVRVAARKRLAQSDVKDQQQGAFMLTAVGTPADGADLVKALDAAIELTRTQPAEKDIYPVPRGACQELLRAAEILVSRGLAPSAIPKSAGEIAVWLVALKGGARPPAWEAELEREMKHAIPYVRQLAMQYAPDTLAPSFMTVVASNLAHTDEDVVVAAAELARRAKWTALAKDVVKAMAKPIGLRLNIVSNAASVLGARFDRAQALLARLSSKDAFDEALGELVELLVFQGRSTNGYPSDAERVSVAARWKTFIQQHRADIEAQRRIPLTDPTVTPDLVPKEWKLGRGDGTEWP